MSKEKTNEGIQRRAGGTPRHEALSACGTTMMANYLNSQVYDKDGRTPIRILPPASRETLDRQATFARTINHFWHGTDMGTILRNIS
jgi:hypothetical protein